MLAPELPEHTKYISKVLVMLKLILMHEIFLCRSDMNPNFYQHQFELSGKVVLMSQNFVNKLRYRGT